MLSGRQDHYQSINQFNEMKMQVYVPLGAAMSESEKADWISNVEKATNEFHQGYRSKHQEFDVSSYRKLLKESEYKLYITEMWQSHYDRAEELLLGNSQRLLKDDLLRWAFFLTAGSIWQQSQVPFLESRWKQEQLEILLKEDHVFEPNITSSKYFSSETLINHLSHLTSFQDTCDIQIKNQNCFVELGGGYGSMCRLVRRMNPHCTYIIVDLPVFLIVQHFYLREILGDEEMNVVDRYNSEIIPEKINFIDISNTEALKNIAKLKPDVFIATWSLSEANDKTQEVVFDLDYFTSKYILIGYRHYADGNVSKRMPFSDSIKLTDRYRIIYNDPTFYSLAREQYYLFAQRG